MKQFGLGNNSEYGTINFDVIRLDIKREEFVANNSAMNTVWNMVDEDGDGILEKKEINKLQKIVMKVINFDKILSFAEAKEILNEYHFDYENDDNFERPKDCSDNMLKFLSKLGMQTKENNSIRYASFEINEMLKTDNIFETGVNNINPDNVLGINYWKEEEYLSIYVDNPNNKEKYIKLGSTLRENIVKLAMQEGFSNDEISKIIDNAKNDFERYELIKEAIIKKNDELEYLNFVENIAKYLNISEVDLNTIKNSDNYIHELELLIENKCGANLLKNFKFCNISHFVNILEYNWHDKLQEAIKSRYSELNGETRTDRYDIDLGNGKIDKPALQKTNNCWIHAGINSLNSNSIGKKFLENNLFKDSSRGLIAVHLQAAENAKVPLPKGDGIYVFSEKEIADAADKYSCGDGDITAYCLAVEYYLQTASSEKTTSESGNGANRLYDIVFGTTEGYNDDIKGFIQYETKQKNFSNLLNDIRLGNVATLGINGHAYSVVGYEGTNLLVQESTLQEDGSKMMLERSKNNINGLPTFILPEYYFELFVDSYSSVSLPLERK